MCNHIEVLAKRDPGWVTVTMNQADYVALGRRSLSIGSHGYPQIWVGESARVEVLHRWILGLVKGDGHIGDHIDGDKLNNARCNLRIVTPSGSSQNVSGRGKSRFRGVHPTAHGYWTAIVKWQGKVHYLGNFDDELDAARAADQKRRKLMPAYVLRRHDEVALYGPAGYRPDLPRPTARQYRARGRAA